MNNSTDNTALKEFTILKFLDKIKWIYEKSGVDYNIMRKIFKLKLIMDQRRPQTALASSRKEPKEDNNYFNLVYAIFGLIIGSFIFLPYPVFIKMNLVIGMIMFMIMSTMISDYSSVLLDLRDKNILLTRPMNSKTINAAKLTHILYYLFSLNLAIAGPSIAFSVFVYGVPFSIVYLIVILFISAFVVFFTSILYYAILNFFDGERLKDFINYFQIILTVFMSLAYQFIGRIFSLVDLKAAYSPKLWHLLVPTTWFAAPLYIISEKAITPAMIAFSMAGVIIPVATLVLYIKKVGPSFEKKLLKLNTHYGKNEKIRDGLNIRRNPIISLFCRERLEYTFYYFIKSVVANERKLKLKLYPTFAFAAIFPLLFLFNQFNRFSTFEQSIKSLSQGKYYLYLYLSCLFLTSSLLIFTYSEKFKGAWIYKAIPVKSPVVPIKAGLKVFFLRYVLPVLLISSIPFMLIYKVAFLKHLLIIILNSMLACLIYFNLLKKHLPLSRDFSNQQDNSERMILFNLFIFGLMTALHYASNLVPYGIYIYTAVVLILFIITWKVSFNFDWKDIT